MQVATQGLHAGIWQRGPWLLIDRVSGKVTALRLPDYDPAVSEVSWFRDYAAYCGLNSTGHGLYAVVAQIATRKPVLSKKSCMSGTPLPLARWPHGNVSRSESPASPRARSRLVST